MSFQMIRLLDSKSLCGLVLILGSWLATGAVSEATLGGVIEKGHTSTTCTLSAPQLGCTVTVTVATVAQKKPTCPEGHKVEVTASIVCGDSQCGGSFKFCPSEVVPLTFLCNGTQVTLSLANGTWGDLADGARGCKNIVVS